MYNNVWVIDDSEIDQMVAEQTLKQLKFARQHLSFRSAADALAKLQQPGLAADEIPDLIFLDIHMPGMNGFQFLGQWHLVPDLVRAQCKVVVVSSVLPEKNAEQLQAYPFVYSVLQKPMRKEMLVGISKS